MVDFTNGLITRTKSQHKVTADFVTGVLVLAAFVILIVAQLTFAIRHPVTLAAAEQQAHFGIIAP